MNKTLQFKKIRLKDQRKEEAEKISSSYGISPVVSRILAARGFSIGADLENFLNPTLQSSLPAPEKLKNNISAAQLIARHAAQGNSVAICSDFDVDGLSSSALLANFLQEAGIKHETFVPDRFSEGYGLNERIVRAASESGHKLLVALDYGTSNIKEFEIARELGLQTIVIDHHHLSSSGAPPCDIFVNPHQPGCGFASAAMCTAGLAFYLLIALRKQIPAAADIDLRNYLDLCCLGTICDMVPLLGVNRLFALKGLEILSTSKRVGLKALKDVSGISNEVSGYHVGFGLGPRINAAGRMLSGSAVIELLTTEDSIKAKKIATQLNKLNTERQDVEARMKEQAINKILKHPELPYGLAVWDSSYHTGVIGIVAQRLVEYFYRPAIVMGSDQGRFKGSVRGVSGFSVVATLQKMERFFTKFGGHTAAGGFSLKNDNVEEFAQAWNSECHEFFKNNPEALYPHISADTEVNFAELDTVLCEELQKLSPFGMGNPGPQLLVKNLKVKDVQLIKAKHLKATLTEGQRYLPALMWQTARHPQLFSGSNIDIICKPEINAFQSQKNIQLILQAVAAAG